MEPKENTLIINKIDDLSIEELLMVYDHVVKKKEKLTNPNSLGEAILENHSLKCNFCQCEKIWKNGLDKYGRQKYICSKCNKTIRPTNTTILSSTKKNLIDWNRFIKTFINVNTCVLAAEESEINPKTAFLWRHKLMKCLSSITDDVTLSGTIWLDEFQTSRNCKGQSYDLNRPKRLHGADPVYDVAQDTIIILLGIDDNDNILAYFADYGKILSQDIAYELLKDKITKGSKVITDFTQAYNKLIKELNLNQVSYKSNDISEQTLLEKKTMDDLCSNLASFLYRFNGVKDKYLQDYLNYFVFLRKIRYTESNIRDKMVETFNKAVKSGYKLKLRDLYLG